MMNTILIVDDNPNNVSLLLKHLQHAQFRVLVAENGQVGLERAAYIKPNLILLDVMMPGLDGFETCRLLKLNETTRHIPVIFMTALSGVVDKVRGFEVGGVDYITKPLVAQEVLARVTTHLTMHRLQNDLESMVAARTAALEAEIEQRQKREAEKDDLLQVIRSQSEQLHRMSRLRQTAQAEINGTLSPVVTQLQSNLTDLDTILSQFLLRMTDLANNTWTISQLKQGLALINHSRELIAHQVEPTSPPIEDDPRITLPPRELEVLHFVAKGYSNRDIAEKLHLAVGTVSTYRARLMRRLEADNATDLIKLAMKYNLLSNE